MRGRDIFRRVRIFIMASEWIARLLPPFVLECLWTATDSYRSKAALGFRFVMARSMTKNCGQVIYIGPYVSISGWNNLILGSNVSIHRGCYLDAAGGITIGSDVSIAHSTSILSTNHQWDSTSIPIRDNPVIMKPVVIEDDVWIGCGCRIMPGVHVGRRSVIAAGAVVTHDVAAGTVVGGVPARLLKHLPQPSAEQ